MVDGISKFIYLPVKLADQLGLFKAENLRVELLSQRAGVDAENEFLSGAVQAVAGAYDHTMDLQLWPWPRHMRKEGAGIQRPLLLRTEHRRQTLSVA